MFKDKIINEGNWDLSKDIDKMWNVMANCIKRVAKFKGYERLTKETWWSDKEKQEKIR